jgi:hypothetical protein
MATQAIPPSPQLAELPPKLADLPSLTTWLGYRLRQGSVSGSRSVREWLVKCPRVTHEVSASSSQRSHVTSGVGVEKT